MKVEFAKTKDAGQLAELDLIGNSEISGWEPNNEKDFIKIIKNFKSIIVVRDNEKIIGYLSLRPDKESKWIWVEDIYVLRNQRQKGIAKLLIKKLVKYKKIKMSKRRIVLLTADRNLGIFRKLGFKKTMNFMEFEK